MKRKLKSNRAITLVALVITIVIIIILSTIAINFTFGENGLIAKAQQAAEMTQVSQIQERLEMAKGTAAIDGNGDIDTDHYFDIIEDEGIIGDKETDVEDNGEGSYDVTTDGDYVFEVTPKPDGDLEIEYVGKNNEPRISKIKVTEKTDDSISVEVVTKNMDNAKYTYSYKKTEEGEESWQEAESESGDNTYTFSGLESNASYDIKVTVTAGDTTLEKTITVQIGTGIVEVPDGTITFGQVAWQGDGTASMTVTTTEPSFTLQYQVGSTSGQWTTITSGQSITELHDGDTVYARLTDEAEANASKIQQTTIEDSNPPIVRVTAQGKATSNSIEVSVEAEDKETGMADSIKYTYYIKKSNEESTGYVAQATDVEQNIYTFNNLQSGISYDIKVEVKSDKAGNMGTGYLAGQTTTNIPGGSDIVGNQITVGETVWAEGKASIEVSTDTEYSIEYQINGTTEGSWTNIGNSGTISDLSYGNTVNIRLTDGANHGDFVTVTIDDEIEPTVNVSLSTTTSNSIAVNVEATDNESGMSSNPVYTYYIKESSQEDGSYKAPEGATEIGANTYTFAGLKQNTSYDIKVEVKADLAGNTGTGTLLNQKTKTIPSGGGDTEQGITFSTPSWSEGKASITVSTEEEYQIEYKLNNPEEDSGWTTIENDGAITELSHGSTVYARLTDGNNYGDYAQTTIRDEINPVVDVKLNGLTTSNSIKVNVTASDNESGMTASPTYTYYIKQSSEQDTAYQTQAGSTNLSTNTYTFTGLTQGTSYDIKVEVTGDNAGNTGAGYLAGQSTQNIPDGSGEEVQEGAITFSTPSWSSNKASITVNTNTSYQIEYQVGNTTEGSWTGISNGGTISNLQYNNMVYARLTDGVNHGEYASVKIDDKLLPQAAGISLSTTSVTTTGSITATVTHTDSESGVNITGSKWVYNTTAGNIGTDEASYTNSFTENPKTLTLRATTPGTYYLHVLTVDLAGNKIEKVSEAVTVRQLVTSVSVNPTSATITEGDTKQLSVTISPSNASNKTVQWSSNKTSVATVSSSGLVTAKAAGSVTITVKATDGSNKQATCSITVKAKVPTIDDAKPSAGADGPTFSKNTPVSDDEGNTVVIPGGFHLDKDSGTSVEEGIVIEDSKGNQFVWIPTGTYQTSSGSKTNNLSRRTFTSSGSTPVSGDNAIDSYYYGEGNRNSVAYNQIGAFKDSVSRNGGFYIGRYELGSGNVVKAGVGPSTSITRDKAKSDIENMYKGNSYVVSELISSYAWDTALNFICQTNSPGYTLATTTSSSYGNIGTGSKQNTGVDTNDNYSNIHDLLGNCREWTTECYSPSYTTCVYRGGSYYDSSYCAAGRGNVSLGSSYHFLSARAQLYVK